jgi:hypothetical protein
VEIEKISKDERPIEGVWGTGSEDVDPVGATVGHKGVTAIQPYREDGQMSLVTWFAVYRGDELWKRLNCAYVAEITYAPRGE